MRYGSTLVVLAGGRGSRVGYRFKPILRLGGKPLIVWVLSRLSSIFDEVIVSVSSDSYRVLLCRVLAEHLKPQLLCKVRFTVDEYFGLPYSNPVLGLYNAIREVNYMKVFITGCDMPFLKPQTALKILSKLNRGYEAVVPLWSRGFIEPLSSGYLLPSLLRLLPRIASLSIKQFRTLYNYMKVYYIPVEELNVNPYIEFFNINSLRDLDLAEKILYQTVQNLY